MATGRTHGFLRPLDGLLAEGSAAGLTDGQLLERFATRGGPAAEQAFAALVERHGPMVLRVCRGVLGRSHEADAEDAFQAVFLVLVKRARSLWVADSIGPWLHQVALRTASCARGAARRRRRHEAAGARPAEAIVNRALDEDRDDLGRILHEEIGRLPDRFRIPVVLCDLEGQTHEQAARHAGWPVGTIKSRLTRARERLRGRLTRRGVSPAGAVIPAIRLDLDAQVPDALVRSTTAAAARLAATHSLAGTAAGFLAQGVLSTMARSIWWKAGAVILAAAAVSGAGLVAGQGAPAKVADPAPAQPSAANKKALPEPDPTEKVLIFPAVAGPFRVVVSGPGTLNAINRSVVKSEVEGGVALLSILPEGSLVKKGDKVAELDSTALREQLTRQQKLTSGSERASQIARQARFAAEAVREEYERGTLPQSMADLRREIDLASEGIAASNRRIVRLRSRIDSLKKTLEGKGAAATPSEITALLDLEDRQDRAELDLKRAEAARESARARLDVLVKFTGPRTIEGLKVPLEKARAEEQTAGEDASAQVDRRQKLLDQLDRYTLVAPRDGRLVYANPPTKNRDRSLPPIVRGAEVRQRQFIFYVDEVDGPIQVVAKLDEPTIHRVKKGQKAEVRIDAFPDRRFTGLVAEVAPLPDPTSYLSTAKKVYTTTIRLEEREVTLRPGMTASVDVLVAQHDNALTVPVKAVISQVNSHRVAVKLPDGRIELREVTLGDSDESQAEVKTGLQAGDRVIINPVGRLVSPKSMGSKPTE
ncbi:sigma-70 family RNA polymerase sigma factor [Aquisphaera insulae]|uniref:sigma-70 family RNA polymerase sigma factor n=1 Tax=Aquisphaera insulae TaxID=2712864 RepID=UPI00202F3399|nr:sigma-70 family RNA polymerase sigma factor [Aquisphaera insulae]